MWDALAVTYSSGKDKLQIFDSHVKANGIKQNGSLGNKEGAKAAAATTGNSETTKNDRNQYDTGEKNGGYGGIASAGDERIDGDTGNGVEKLFSTPSLVNPNLFNLQNIDIVMSANNHDHLNNVCCDMLNNSPKNLLVPVLTQTLIFLKQFLKIMFLVKIKLNVLILLKF